MADLIELERTLPSLFKTYENENILFIAKIREETIYFFELLTSRTIIVLLTKPECYELYRTFIEIMAHLHVTVIELDENETFSSSYQLSNKSKTIINDLLTNYKYKRVVTHPNYELNDPQNTNLYKFVSSIINNLNNHYTYNKTVKERKLCRQQLDIIKMYSYVVEIEKITTKNVYDNYIQIASSIDGLKLVI